MYFDYLKETKNQDTILKDYGFVVYEIDSETKIALIADMWIKPEFRENGHAFELADAVSQRAKEEGCKKLICTLDPTIANAERNVKVFKKYGFRFSKINQDIIYFEKEI